MELSEEKYNRLQRFIDMEMTEAEVYAFEKELEDDATLKEQWLFELQLRDAFLEREIKQEEAVTPISYKSLDGFVWWKPVAAASVFILISLLVLHPGGEKRKEVLVKQAVDTLVKKNPDSNLVKAPVIAKDTVNKLAKAEALFKKYYKKEPPPDEYPIELADAFEKYAVGDYSGFDKLDADNLGELRSGEDRNKTKQLVLFYKGIVAMERREMDLAIKLLERIKGKYDSNLIISTKVEKLLNFSYLYKKKVQ